MARHLMTRLIFSTVNNNFAAKTTAYKKQLARRTKTALS